MNQKAKGTLYERDLIHKLWAAGFACIRAAGSGSMRHPSPDILAGNNLRILAIECKSSKNDRVYIPLEEINQLKIFCNFFGAEPWIALKCKGEEWFFLNPEDIPTTKKNYVVSVLKAREIGLLFEEVIKS